MNKVNKDIITLEDVIEMYEMRGMATIINDGKVIGFVEGE